MEEEKEEEIFITPKGPRRPKQLLAFLGSQL
jgi:hypothetical protein